MEHFAIAWHQLGGFLHTTGDDKALGVIAAAQESAARLVDLLDQMPYFHDVHPYRSGQAKFYKRAQITAYDLAVAFDHVGPGHFRDVADLTMFADNLVPHVLRIEGVIEFSDLLLSRVEAVNDITSGTEPEVEIRACGLHCVELMVAELSAQGEPHSAAFLDGILWRMGARPKYKSQPRHRSRCVYY